jgi:HlyD family secretion protein
MTQFFKKILKNKLLTGGIAVVLLIGGYFGITEIVSQPASASYIVSTVEKGTLITSISGSGQISAANQIDLKVKSGGDLVYLNVKNGQEVKSGTLLASTDASDASISLRNAQTSLETAKLELEELSEPTDELTLLQAENSLLQLKESKQKAEDNLIKINEDGYNSVVSVFFDMPGVMTDLENIIYGETISKPKSNISAYADMVRLYNEFLISQCEGNVRDSYQTARGVYDDNFEDYKNTDRFASLSEVESLINETYETAKKIAVVIKNTDNFLSYVKDTLAQSDKDAPALMATHQALIKTDTTKINSIISSLSSIKTSIKSTKDSITSAERSLAEKELSVAKLKSGADSTTIRAKQISVQQKEDSLYAAQKALANNYVRAPFDGIATNVTVKKGDSVSASTVITTLITKQRIAEISLNEVDVANVKVGQKVNLTFDAIEDLEISGEIADVDTFGTVSQGVVTYDAKIIFDTQDDRVKPGMSVSATIITDVKTDCLMVPNSAVKSIGDNYYVEVPSVNVSDESLQSTGGISLDSYTQKTVQIGVANDTSTEIIDGLKEDDQVIVRTVTASTGKTTTSSGTSLFNMGGSGKTSGSTKSSGGTMMPPM